MKDFPYAAKRAELWTYAGWSTLHEPDGASRVTLIIIFGPPAAGKMAVGLELERLTGFRLFHNHMTVDPVLRLFPFESPLPLSEGGG